MSKVNYGYCLIYTTEPGQICPLCRMAVEPCTRHECVYEQRDKPKPKPSKRSKNKSA